MGALQAPALPLGDATVFAKIMRENRKVVNGF
jgi:hypothetical protein